MRRLPPRVTETAAPAYVYLLGTYLGDGCLSAHPRGVYKLRVYLDLAYPGIIREVVGAITKGKLDFGPWEQVFYGEFDGRRPKRVLVKVIGE